MAKNMEQTKRFKRLQEAITGQPVEASVINEVMKQVTYHHEEFKNGELPVSMFYSGKISISMPPELHAAMAAKARSESKSMNRWVVDTIKNALTGA